MKVAKGPSKSSTCVRIVRLLTSLHNNKFFRNLWKLLVIFRKKRVMFTSREKHLALPKEPSLSVIKTWLLFMHFHASSTTEDLRVSCVRNRNSHSLEILAGVRERAPIE